MANQAKLKRALRKQLMREAARNGASSSAPSKPSQPVPLRWQEQPAADRARAEAFDGFAPLRNKLREVAAKRHDWAGIPMPLDGERLVVEPSFPNAQALMKMCGERDDEREPEAPDLIGAKVVNSFWSDRKRGDILIIRKADGRTDWGLQPGIHHLMQDLRTLGCAEAWGIEQESQALNLLGTLLDHRRFKQYLMTGSFLESSPRSKVTYLFRRLKPTVAIATKGESTRILCALCLHPIAYYQGSWAGAMTPTDDVVAHLMLMRGDEQMYWKRSNQHPAYRPEAGL